MSQYPSTSFFLKKSMNFIYVANSYFSRQYKSYLIFPQEITTLLFRTDNLVSRFYLVYSILHIFCRIDSIPVVHIQIYVIVVEAGAPKVSCSSTVDTTEFGSYNSVKLHRRFHGNIYHKRGRLASFGDEHEPRRSVLDDKPKGRARI